MSYDEIMKELNEMVGLDEIKRRFKRIYDVAKFKKSPLKPSQFIFIGNPGTGKTEVARLIGKIYHALGVLPTSKVVEVSKADLMGPYEGDNLTKSLQKCKEALGGVLLIDETCQIDDSDIITVILKFMEDHHDSMCVIFVGYKELMRKFISSNPGLLAKIGQQNIIEFPDYSVDELMQIAVMMAQKKGLTLDESFFHELHDILNNRIAAEHFGNAREVRNIIEEASGNLAIRLADIQNNGGSVSEVDKTTLIDKDLRG